MNCIIRHRNNNILYYYFIRRKNDSNIIIIAITSYALILCCYTVLAIDDANNIMIISNIYNIPTRSLTRRVCKSISITSAMSMVEMPSASHVTLDLIEIEVSTDNDKTRHANTRFFFFLSINSFLTLGEILGKTLKC